MLGALQLVNNTELRPGARLSVSRPVWGGGSAEAGGGEAASAAASGGGGGGGGSSSAAAAPTAASNGKPKQMSAREFENSVQSELRSLRAQASAATRAAA